MVQSREIMQAAYVVDDLDVAIDNWRRVAGVGPFFVMRDNPLDDLTYRGRPSEPFRSNFAMVQAGPIQLELIQPLSSGPNIYRDSVPVGTDAYHHQAYLADDLDVEFARFEAMGVEVAAHGSFGSLRFAYFDTRHLVGCMTEVLERGATIEGMIKMVADAAINWDGSDPVRSFG
jgi:methylmalonyl-CoA/ethylmalonyl-CoA epimerase